jgi:hypothetical protein
LKGIIETLSAGFEAVIKRFWILLIPITLDLFLWLGPKVSLYPLMQRGLAWMQAIAVSQPSSEALANAQQFWQQANMAQIWEQFGQQFNLLYLLPGVNIVALLSLGLLDLPSLAATNALPNPLADAMPIVQISDGWTVVGLVIAILGGGLFLSVLYQGLIAQEVREEQLNPRYLLRRSWLYWRHLARVALGFLMLLIIVGWPVMLLLFVLGALSPTLMQFLFLLVSIALFWIALYLSLTPHGILLGEEKPVVALLTSVNLIQRNFGSAMFLLLLSRLIRLGLGFVWPLLTRTVPGTVVAIVGNAFVCAGLAAASFIFYRDRFTVWREQLAKAMAAAAAANANNPPTKPV